MNAIKHYLIIAFLFPYFFTPLHAIKNQFFLGLGQSINEGKLTTNIQNQMTKNTSSVNEKGGYYYSQTQLGDYNGSIKDITNLSLGNETTFDKKGIFTLRAYVSFSFSNKVNFGNLSNVRDGNMRYCAANELPGLSNICVRDGFFTSSPSTGNYPEIKFNANPGFSNTISQNAFMMTYGLGLDFGINLPITVLMQTFSNQKKIIPLRIGAYAGIGYEFNTYSLGRYDGRTYNNTTSGGATRDPATGTIINAPGITLDATDSLYLSGSGMFAKFGASAYISNNLRFDFGIKMPITITGIPTTKSQKWYQVESNQIPNDANGQPIIDPIFAQQLLKQEYTSKLDLYWQFAINVLF